MAKKPTEIRNYCYIMTNLHLDASDARAVGMRLVTCYSFKPLNLELIYVTVIKRKNERADLEE